MAREQQSEVFLIRSGMTEWDEQRRIQGRTDLPLSTTGRRSLGPVIEEIATLLGGNTTPNQVHSAPDEASRQTANLLAERIGSKVRVIQELESMDLGLWEGILEDEIEARYPSACRLWLDQPQLVQPPKGEAFADADARIRLAVSRVFERAERTPILIVCRPLSYAMATCWLAGRPSTDVWSLLEDGPAFQRLTLKQETLKTLLDELKAGA